MRKPERNGDSSGEPGKPDQHPGERIGELDADPLVVGAVVVKRVGDVVPQLGRPPRGAPASPRPPWRFRPSAWRIRGPWPVPLGPRACDGEVPRRHEHEEQHDGENQRASPQRDGHEQAPSTIRLMAKLSTYSSGLAGSNVLPMITYFLLVVGGRGQAHLRHHLLRVGGEVDLLGDPLVIDVALDVAPALHLRQDPDGHGVPREGIEVDPVRLLAHVAETVGEGPRQNLLHHRFRLVQVVLRRDGLGDFLAIGLVGGVGGRLDDRLEQRQEGVRVLVDERLATPRRRSTGDLSQMSLVSMWMKPTPS